MQQLSQNYGYFAFLFETRCEIYFMQASQQNLCMPSEDQDIDSPSCCHGNHLYLATKFRNMVKHLETQYKHSMFTNG